MFHVFRFYSYVNTHLSHRIYLSKTPVLETHLVQFFSEERNSRRPFPILHFHFQNHINVLALNIS